MTTAFATFPQSNRVRLSRVNVPAAILDGVSAPVDADGLSLVDLDLVDGKIAAVQAAGQTPAGTVPVFDLDYGMAMPGFVDLHTHLDKGHIWRRQPNPNGTFDGALAAVRADREANWSAEDVRRRMDFALRCAFAHGTVAVRTHLDSLPPQWQISWPVFRDLRSDWAGRIALSASCLVPSTFAEDAAGFTALADEVAKSPGGVLGAVTFMGPRLEAELDICFRAAIERGLDLDFHVDETADPAADSLRAIAEAAVRYRFQGRIVVGHCCSIARQAEDVAKRTLDKVAAAGIGVVSLPMCNMYLQDRVAGRTPRWRGVTLVHEMRARGIPVAVASDNARDPFHAYGDLDMVETWREAVRILHFDHPFGDWPRAVAATPAAMAGIEGRGLIGPGRAADLVLFRAREWTELISRPQADRIVLRAGAAISRVLPDYRELDDLMIRDR